MKIAWIGFIAVAVPFVLAGCQRAADKAVTEKRATEKQRNDRAKEAEIQAARAKLPPEDRWLVEAQDFCPIMPDNRLGVMGPPFKVVIKDQPVFLCCKGCRRKALADPDTTLSKVEQLKVKTKELQKGGE